MTSSGAVPDRALAPLYGPHLTFWRQRIFQQTAMAVPSPTSKDDLRHEALRARRDYAHSLAPATREALEEALAEIVLPHLLTARIVGGYHPMRDEISPLPLLARLGEGQRPALPWFVERDSRMLFRDGPAIERGPWGLLQPSAEAPAAAPDVLIVPLVLADRFGTRIGRGQGHYDRALAHLREAGPIFTIGIGWELQIADVPLPADAWDVPLDALATPGEWVDCRRMHETRA